MSAICPICHLVEPLWLDAPPTACTQTGGTTLCRSRADMIRAMAMCRALAPEAFENDKLRKGRAPNGKAWLIYAFDKCIDAGVDYTTGLLADETRPPPPPPPDDGGDDGEDGE